MQQLVSVQASSPPASTVVALEVVEGQSVFGVPEREALFDAGGHDSDLSVGARERSRGAIFASDISSRYWALPGRF